MAQRCLAHGFAVDTLVASATRPGGRLPVRGLLSHMRAAASTPTPAAPALFPPSQVIARIKAATQAAMQRPDVRERLAKANERREPHTDEAKVRCATTAAAARPQSCPACLAAHARSCFLRHLSHWLRPLRHTAASPPARRQAPTRPCAPPNPNPQTTVTTTHPPPSQEKIRVKLQERANAAREEIHRQAEVILHERLGGSDDPELRELAAFPRALDVISGLAWQYFKKDWSEVRRGGGGGACRAAQFLRNASPRRGARVGAGNAVGEADGCRPCPALPSWHRPRPQVSTRGWDEHPDFRERCISKLRKMARGTDKAPRKVGGACCARCAAGSAARRPPRRRRARPAAAGHIPCGVRPLP